MEDSNQAWKTKRGRGGEINVGRGMEVKTENIIHQLGAREDPTNNARFLRKGVQRGRRLGRVQRGKKGITRESPAGGCTVSDERRQILPGAKTKGLWRHDYQTKYHKR